MKFHPRSDWGAREPEHRSSIGDVYGCTVHWHGPGLGAYDHGDCSGLVRSMQDFHMDSNGWSDLGYNLLSQGVELGDDTRAALVVGLTGLIGSAYYLVARLAERRWPELGRLLGAKADDGAEQAS